MAYKQIKNYPLSSETDFDKHLPGVSNLLKKIARKFRLMKVGHGEKGVYEVGHRNYVGGLWEEIGSIQFDFLLSSGISPDCYFLDVGCGSLRLGVHMIPYLDEGRYFAVDKEESLITLGIQKELGEDVWNHKNPIIFVSEDFPFQRFPQKAKVAWCHSLFTHLTPELIEMCLHQLRGSIDQEGVFYATFFESDELVRNPRRSHDHKNFFYTRSDMEQLGKNCGWRSEYIGEWGHPRNQVIIRYKPG